MDKPGDRYNKLLKDKYPPSEPYSCKTCVNFCQRPGWWTVEEAKGFCELFDTGLQPLECRFFHHDRPGLGTQCHLEIEKEWNTDYAKRLIIRWGNETGFWQRQGLFVKEK